MAGSILTAVHFILSRHVSYSDLDQASSITKTEKESAKRLIRRLNDLGLNIEVKNAA